MYKEERILALLREIKVTPKSYLSLLYIYNNIRAYITTFANVHA